MTVPRLEQHPSEQLHLEDEEVAGLDEDANGLEPVVVLFPGDERAIDAVFAGSCHCDPSKKPQLFPPGVNVREHDVSAAVRLVWVRVPEGVHEIPQLVPAEMDGTHAQHEADGVHEVGLPRAVGADDGCEVAEGTDDLVALVALEVAHLHSVDPPTDLREARHGGGCSIKLSIGVCTLQRPRRGAGYFLKGMYV